MDGASEQVEVDFSRRVPLFPLETVALLPCAVVPLHIYEPRYVQMVTGVLDRDGLLAMAVLDRSGWCCETFGDPPIRRSVCVGRIVQHHLIPDGRYQILLQGICRARVVEHTPADSTTLYRRALLRPLESDEQPDTDSIRHTLTDLFSDGPLAGLSAAESVVGALRSPEAPVCALLELIGMSAIGDTDVRYKLLDDGRAERRASLLIDELRRLQTLLYRAGPQRDALSDQPKGVWLN